MKHTPGPWTLSDEGTHWDLLSDKRTNDWIAKIISGYDRDEANARLIVVAPKMYELCEHLFEWCADHFGDFDPEINAQLLCLSNDAESILNEVNPENVVE